MKVIPLTQGLFAQVDDSDYERIVNFGLWYAIRNKRVYYAATVKDRTTIFMHNLIMGPNGLVDHIDHDGLNNQRCNLRIATASQSCMNRRKPRNNTSGYKGVYQFYLTGKWIGQIRANGKRYHLGCFNTPEDAALAYNKAALIHHGEYAVLNKINNNNLVSN